MEWLGLPAEPSARFARCCELLVPGGAKLYAPSDILPTVPQTLLTQRAASESAPGESTSAFATEAVVLLQLGGRKCGALKITLGKLLGAHL